MEQKKTEKKIVAGLQSNNQDDVLNTIKQLRDTGTSIYIPLLIELMHSTENAEIRERVFRLLSDLKHSDAIPLIIEAIENQKYSSDLKDLVSSCWENGLDFTSYLPIFVELVIKEDFLIAFEAFTVIENMDGYIAFKTKEEQIEKVKTAMHNAPDEKKQFLVDLVAIISNLQEETESNS